MACPSSDELRRVAKATGMGRRIGHHWMFTRAELDAYAAPTCRAAGTRLEEGARRPGTVTHRRRRAWNHLLDINAAAERLGVSVKRVYQIADEGRIGTRHGTRWLFTVDGIRCLPRRDPPPGRPAAQTVLSVGWEDSAG